MSLIATTSDSAFHITVPPSRADLPHPRCIDRLLSAQVCWSNIRDVWLDGIYSPRGIDTFDREGDPPPNEDQLYTYAESNALRVRSTIVSLPGLERLTIVVDGLKPDLTMLPNLRNPFFKTHALTNIRFVFRHAFNLRIRPPYEMKLQLLELRQELAAGKLGYITTLALQVAKFVCVADFDVARLRMYVPTVTVEHLHTIPEMELPPCCVGDDVVFRDKWMKFAAW
ncbi:hypothetical protein C8Q80DRAFT_1266247 [Daedaleopsis nitida]|nr:hypothetical protein C8Q80DRAFT_1266247 [Daedaleopsis nitida]